MKKAISAILLLSLLTGCWDQLPLRELKLLDVVGLDLDEKKQEVSVHFVVTKLKTAGQGGGEPDSKVTEQKGSSVVNAVENSQYTDQGNFLGINIGTYLLSKDFISHKPIQQLSFLLHAPYSSINTPIVIFDGKNLNKFLNDHAEDKEFTRNLYEFISSLEQKGVIKNVSMMHYILSNNQQLGDLAIPLIKPIKDGVIFNGAQLIREGKNTGEKLNKDQVQMMMLLLGEDLKRKNITGKLPGDIDYAYSIKNTDSNITIKNNGEKVNKITIQVQLGINVYEAGEKLNNLNAAYVNRIEKELSNELDKKAFETIKTIQKANTDVLGVGKELKAYHPTIWKGMNFRKEYPELLIEPHFEVQILNADTLS